MGSSVFDVGVYRDGWPIGARLDFAVRALLSVNNELAAVREESRSSSDVGPLALAYGQIFFPEETEAVATPEPKRWYVGYEFGPDNLRVEFAFEKHDDLIDCEEVRNADP